MPAEVQPLIFVSYVEEEKEIAEFLAARLQAYFPSANVSAYSWKPRPGANWLNELKSNLNAATAVVFLLGPDSVDKKWILFEFGAAWFSDKMLFPILHSGLRKEDLGAPLNTVLAEYAERADLGTTMMNALAEHMERDFPTLKKGKAPSDAEFAAEMQKRLHAFANGSDRVNLFVSFPLSHDAWSNVSVIANPRWKEVVLSVLKQNQSLTALRTDLLSTIRAFVSEYEGTGKKVFFAGAKGDTNINKLVEVDSATQKLKGAREFVLIWPARLASGALCEATLAHSLGIPCRFYRMKDVQLPTYLHNVAKGGQEFTDHKNLDAQLRALYLPETQSKSP